MYCLSMAVCKVISSPVQNVMFSDTVDAPTSHHELDNIMYNVQRVFFLLIDFSLP